MEDQVIPQEPQPEQPVQRQYYHPTPVTTGGHAMRIAIILAVLLFIASLIYFFVLAK